MIRPKPHRCRLLLVSAWAPLLLFAQQKRAVTPEDLVDIRDVSDAQISPDGKHVAFVIREPADPRKPEKARNVDVWIVPADGSETARPFAASPESDSTPRWSPDGGSLAFLSDRGGGQRQVWLMRLDGGDARKLTDSKTGVAAYKWSRDGRMIAFVASDGLAEEAQKKTDQGDDSIQIGVDHRFARLWVIGIGGESPALVTRQDVDVVDFDWSPDGADLVAAYNTPDRFADGRIGIFRRSDGALLRELNSNANSSAEGVRWSPDGRSILFLENSPRKNVGWMSVVSAMGGTARPVAKDFAGSITQCFWAPDSRRVFASAITGTAGKLLEVDTVTGEITTIAEMLQGYPGFSLTTNAGAFAYPGETPDSPTEVWVKIGPNAAQRLTRSNPQIDSIQLGRVREVSWTNRKDGVKLNGVLVTPPAYQEGKPYPMIVEAHTGGRYWWVGWQGSWWQWGQLLSSRGYVVFLPNARGVVGQGWKLHDTVADWGGAALDDILDGVDELVAKKIADPERLGIGGWSNGGFMSLWAITHTDRFKAAVVYEPVTDMSLWWEKCGLNGFAEVCEKWMGGTPNEVKGEYEAHSPLHFVAHARTPTLILHGQRENAVALAGSYEFYRELKSQDVEAALVVYPREPHALQERSHQLDLLRRMQAWFDQHLKP